MRLYDLQRRRCPILVIKLRSGERCRLLLPDGREVWVMVCAAMENAARIGIEAPNDVSIHRESLLTDRALDSLTDRRHRHGG